MIYLASCEKMFDEELGSADTVEGAVDDMVQLMLENLEYDYYLYEDGFLENYQIKVYDSIMKPFEEDEDHSSHPDYPDEGVLVAWPNQKLATVDLTIALEGQTDKEFNAHTFIWTYHEKEQ